MGQDDDDIPDLFPGARPARPAPAAAAPRVAAPVRSAPTPSVTSVQKSINPPPTSSSSDSFDLAPLDEAETTAADPDETGDEFEFDILGATSQRSDAMVPALREAARAAALPPALARPSSAPPAELGLDFELGELPLSPRSAAAPASPAAREAASPAPSPAPAAQRPSAYPPPAAPRPSSYPPPPAPAGGPSAMPAGMAGLGSSGGAADWDLDDALGLAPKMDLVVAVPLPSDTTGDGPWPRGRTPELEELQLDADEIRAASGYGPASRNPFGAALYFVRVSLGRRQVQAALAACEPEFRRAEREKDQLLASLAEALRPELADKERFVSLFSEIDRYDTLIAERQAQLERAGDQGISQLASLELRLAAARADQAQKEGVAAEERAVHAEADRLLKRARAQVNRLEIELRNVEDRARQRVGEGAAMPQDLALRYVSVETEWKGAKLAFTTAEEALKQRVAPLRKAEDEARRAHADADRIEGEREGYVMAHDGDMGDFAGSLEEARSGRIRQLAHAACSVLELRGEVAVALEERNKIHQADRLVEAAARKLELQRRALGSADPEAFALGRLVWLVLGAALIVGLVVAALR